jgi:hypothetical protein
MENYHYAGMSKPQKININMEIKNLNIFGATSSTNNLHSTKKKLHKKTISCLPLQNK